MPFFLVVGLYANAQNNSKAQKHAVKCLEQKLEDTDVDFSFLTAMYDSLRNTQDDSEFESLMEQYFSTVSTGRGG